MAKGNKQTRSNLGSLVRTGGPGRPKGSKNLTSRQAQQEILDTLGKLNKAKFETGPKKGQKKYPHGYLHHLAEDEPKTFAALFGRCLPRDMTLEAAVSLNWEGLVKLWNRGREKS